MRFLVDHCVSQRTTDFLRGLGHEPTTLKSLGLAELEDSSVLQLSIQRDEVLLAEDKGFGNILDYPPRLHQGIILLSIRTRNRKGLHALLRQFLFTANRDDLRQKLIVIDDRMIRIRQ